MDTTPIYALRERLRAAGIAGTSLLSEDFRLKRAYEAFLPLEAASPVFAKLGQMTAQLLSPDCSSPQGALLDTLALADAVICTLAAVDRKGDIEPFSSVSEEQNAGRIVNVPCSVLKELLDALTTSGGGHYASVCELHDKSPEIFADYRVRHVLVQALDASYSELADKVEEWLIESNDRTMLPLLYQDFDPRGKKEMVRRVRIINALAGAGANDFYVRMLDEAQKDVRAELIDALRHEPQNVPLLLDLSRTERGKNKDKVYELLAEIQHEDVRAYFQELAQKKPDIVLNYLKNTTVDWSAELVAGICDAFLERLETVDQAPDQELRKLFERLRKIVRAFFGKGGTNICACYQKLLMKKETVDLLFKKAWQKPKNAYGGDVLQYGVLRAGSYREKVNTREIETALGKVLHHSLIVNPDPDLQALALELYQNKSSSNPNIKFLPAAATAKFSCDEDCVGWLEEQVMGGAIPEPKYSKECMKALIEAAAYIEWNETEEEYMFSGTYIDVYYPDYKTVQRPISLRHAKEIMEWVMSHSSKKADEVLAQWVMLNNEEMCQTMGAYFYKKALITEDNHIYLNYMKNCLWNICKGLGIYFLRDKQDSTFWELYSWMASLPGDYETVMEEVRAVCARVKSGELKAVNLKNRGV